MAGTGVVCDPVHFSMEIYIVREEAALAAGERIWKRGKVYTDDIVEGSLLTTGKTSGSFTSSMLTVRFPSIPFYTVPYRTVFYGSYMKFFLDTTDHIQLGSDFMLFNI